MVAAGARQVRVHVHPSGHDDHPAGIERGCVIRQARYDSPILDADVADLTIDPIGRIV
jgi:hypothetical protein